MKINCPFKLSYSNQKTKNMKASLRFASLLLGFACIFSAAHSQHDCFAYAVTDLQQTGAGWHALRKLNTQTGEYSSVLLNGAEFKQIAYDATSKQVFQPAPDAKYGNYMQPAFSTGVKAIAYDKKNNRIWFTPMFIDQLRYIDLKTMKLYYVTDQSFTRLGNMHNDQDKIVTRMTIAPDGYGYATTNDGNTFIRFSTGKKLIIEELGGLVDEPNQTISIHNSCSCSGGDMVADDAGHLYIFSARNNVFKVDIETRRTTYLGVVNGLPANFTINGAVVNEEGKLLVSSAVYAGSWAVVDPATWKATAYKTRNGTYKTSDLANSNYLITKRNKTNTITTITKENFGAGKIHIYPNPVSDYRFTIQFSKLNAGDYNVELIDATGRQVMRRRVAVINQAQVENISLHKNIASGVYMVKISSSKFVFSQKIVFSRM